MADIADFFPHIYTHPVERALETATGGSAAAYCLFRFIRNWNAFVSYGLPVGLAGRESFLRLRLQTLMPRLRVRDGNIVATLMTFGSFAAPNGSLTKPSRNSQLTSSKVMG